VVVVAASAIAAPARAEDADGSYGRIEGDLLFVGAAGAAITTQGPQLETHVGLLYMSTAGPYFRYVESFGDEDAAFERAPPPASSCDPYSSTLRSISRKAAAPDLF
jgi:hypothetical protein